LGTSNHNGFRVLFDKIASVYFISKMCLYFSIRNGQPREPALCQLYRHTVVPYSSIVAVGTGPTTPLARALSPRRLVAQTGAEKGSSERCGLALTAVLLLQYSTLCKLYRGLNTVWLLSIGLSAATRQSAPHSCTDQLHRCKRKSTIRYCPRNNKNSAVSRHNCSSFCTPGQVTGVSGSTSRRPCRDIRPLWMMVY